MAPDVAEILARLSQREFFTDDDEIVFGGYKMRRSSARLSRRHLPVAPGLLR